MSKRVCKVEGCNREHYAKGRCSAHYRHWRRYEADLPECSVESCERNVEANGLCHAHNLRQWSNGDPMPDKPIRGRHKWPLEKLMAYHEVDPDTGCWNWLGATDGDGYGVIWINGGNERAHRYAYAKANYLALDELPDGMHVAHHCDTPGCVSPKHLYLATPAENIEDKELADLSVKERRELREA